MKKKLPKYQIGDDPRQKKLNPNIFKPNPALQINALPGSPDYTWDQNYDEQAVYGDALGRAEDIKNYYKQGYKLDPDGKFRKNEYKNTNNNLQYSNFFKGLNTILDLTNLVGNQIQDFQTYNRERKELLNAQYMDANYNAYERGVNNVPVYLKKGGKVKYQVGGGRRLQPQQMQEWNQFLDFVKTKGYEGSEDLNKRNKNLGQSLFNEFKTANPNVSINYDIVPDVQNEMQLLKGSTQDFFKRKNLPGAETIMEGISPVDGWFGSKTSQFRFPEATLVTKNNGQVVGQSNLGLVDSTLQATGAPSTLKTLPKGVKIEPLYDETGKEYGKGYTDASGDIIQLQTGGNVNTTGYLKGAKTNENSYNIIPSNVITTDNMAFPIKANGVPLMPDTGDYIFDTPNVYEEPLKYQVGGNTPQVEGVPNGQANAMLEQGEVFQQGSGQILKVAESEPTHDSAAGGSPQANVDRVLEDTSDKRKDKDSKALRITPAEAEAVFQFKPKSTVSHSKMYELLIKEDEKDLKKAEKTITKNLEYIKNGGGVYAKNSLEENLKFLGEIPTKAERFDEVYEHQEYVKDVYGIDENDYNMYGGKGKLPKYQVAGGTNRRPRNPNAVYDPATQLWYRNQNEVPKQTSQYKNRLNPWVYDSSVSNLQHYNFSDTTTGYQKQIDPNKDLYGSATQYNPIHVTWNDYYFPKQEMNAENFQKSYQQNVAEPLGKRYKFSSDQEIDKKYGNNTYNAPLPGRTITGTKEGVIDLQTYVTAADKDKLAEEYGISRKDLDETFDKSTGYNYYLNIGTPQKPATPPPADAPNPYATKYNLPEEIRASTVGDVGLGWAAGYGNLLGYIDAMGRIPVELEQLNRDYYRVHEEDVTPVINANLSDFNAAKAQLPNSGVGFANQANLQATKYAMNNQALAQVETRNKAKFDLRDREVADQKFQLDTINYQLRDQFRERVLGGREAQRQQKFEFLKGMFQAIDNRNAFVRNANLALELTPYFDSYGRFNGNKYNIALGIPNDQFESTIETLPNGEQRVITRDKRTGKLVTRQQTMNTPNANLNVR